MRRFVLAPTVEPLEGRTLLSGYTGPYLSRPVETPGGMYTVSVSGGGFEKVKQVGHGEVAVTLYGTTASSTLNAALTKPRLHVKAQALQIASITVKSGQLGGISAPGATLNGSLTPLGGQVNTIQFGSLGPNTQIDLADGLGSLSVAGDVDLGPTGHVNINGGIASTLSLGSLELAGGRFVVSGSLAGSLNLGSLSLTQGGQFLVGQNITGSASIGSVSITGVNSLFSVGNNLVGGLSIGQGLTLDGQGQFAIGNDLTGPITVGGSVNIDNNAQFIVNRDATGSLNVSGDFNLASGGLFTVGRNLNAVTINGNLTVAPTGGKISVGGNLTSLTVNGAFQGQGSASGIDLNVGLNLGDLVVQGGGAGLGGLQGVDINVVKSLLGLDIAHGIFNSLITAGVTIDGGTQSTENSGPNIGPDGTDAVLNSQITAGVSITDLTIGGDVRSSFVTNPASTGYPTRIVAGVNRAGQYSNGGLIDNFQITGALIDSVLAASVAPYGGNGTLPTSAYGAAAPSVGAGSGTYNAPAGYITGGTFGNPIQYQNYTETDVFNEIVTGVAWNTTIDPTIDNTILYGAINPSFASPPASEAAVTSSSTVNGSSGSTTVTSSSSASSQAIALPTKSTVLGGVISTPHGDQDDFAGIFAADTRGVFVGTLPGSGA